MKLLIKTIILLTYFNSIQAQTIIWSEDFNSYTDGTTTGTSGKWTSGGCSTCPSSSSDWWEIRNGRMEARDVNNEFVWIQTEVIDISPYTSTQFSVDVVELGDHEGLYLGVNSSCADNSNRDHVDIEYRIDGGAWTIIPNYLGWCGLYSSCSTHTLYGDDGLADDDDCRTTDDDWDSVNVSKTGLVGMTLELRFTARNSSGTEYIQFDNIVVEGISSSLPIELVYFQGEEHMGDAHISWVTATEINNDRFELYRSPDGQYWELITTVDGAGYSNQLRYYKYVDRPNNTDNYYLLKQIDFDGMSSNSNVIYVGVDHGGVNYGYRYVNVLGQQVGDRYKGYKIKVLK